jgi:hypothetical protein
MSKYCNRIFSMIFSCHVGIELRIRLREFAFLQELDGQHVLISGTTDQSGKLIDGNEGAAPNGLWQVWHDVPMASRDFHDLSKLGSISPIRFMTNESKS